MSVEELYVWVFGLHDVDALDLVQYGSPLTTIVSPNYPFEYHPNDEREWRIETMQGEMALITVRDVRVEKNLDTLTITHAPVMRDASTSVFTLTSSNVTAFLLPAGVITVRFCSDVMENLPGFALDVESLMVENTLGQNASDVNMIRDGIPDFKCDSGMQFIRQVARCDHVADCHDFSDEIGCDDCTQNHWRCEGTDICLQSEVRCNGWIDCPLADDEENCDTARCPAGCQCGSAPYDYAKNPTITPCLRDLNWAPYWANCSRRDGWTEKDARILSSKTNIMYLQYCQILRLRPGVFDGLFRLEMLNMQNNSVTYLESGTFRGLYHLKFLWLGDNDVIRLDEGCFRDLRSLTFLDLGGNPLTELKESQFADLGSSLERILLKNTNLTVLNATLFSGIDTRLVRLNLRETKVHTLERGTFGNMSHLEDLVFSSFLTTPLYPEVFDGLHSLKAMYVYDPRLCCLAPNSATCVVEIPTHPLFTCRKTFLQNSTIKTFIFILGISALFGNGIVIFIRLQSKSSSDMARVQSTLITNLAASDFLMGVYMFILAIMDIYVGDSYFWDGRAEEWRSSTPCQILGFISVISSEVSVFILTVISVDRFLCIMFPFSSNRLRPMSCTIVVTVVWFLAFLLGATSILLNQFVPDAYSLSDVCVGLPFIRKPINPEQQVDERAMETYLIPVYQTAATASVSTWRFSTVLFLGINLVSFCVIALAYIMIFINVRFVRTKVGKQANQSAGEVKMAVRMFLIVGTDFFCWMPIIILGILVQTVGITVTPDIYAWLVVFVLPINSSLNPFIYTIAHVISERTKK
ncbi:uncharacterized protein [Diadema setosum]|uniref:uncharacterized protein n=1 Tax=Diadema setosum TaxID=31175 RepID=UPI003B3A3161